MRGSLVLVLLALAGAACDRNIEPYDPNEKVATPDLSKIFPEAAERSGEGEALRGVMPEAAAPAPEPPGGEAEPLAGSIRITPELAERVPQGAVLFLIARTGGGGPPTAVRRISDPSFPLDFEIGPDDRMIDALPFTGPFQLTARIDADGNAMSRNPGDLQGDADGTFEPGAHDIENVIDEVL
jgi:hypothetical protein